MSLYLRLGGAALLLVGAIFVSREYSGYIDRRISEYRSLVALLSHAEGKISRFLSFGGELWRDFSDDVLEGCGLLPLLRGGSGLALAFDECKAHLALPSEAKERIFRLLSGLGGGYMDGTIAGLSSARQELEAELTVEQEAAEKNKRVARALLIGGALAVGVMVI